MYCRKKLISIISIKKKLMLKIACIFTNLKSSIYLYIFVYLFYTLNVIIINKLYNICFFMKQNEKNIIKRFSMHICCVKVYVFKFTHNMRIY